MIDKRKILAHDSLMILRKVFKPFFRSLLPVLWLGIATGGIFLYFQGEKQILKWDLESALRENKDLQEAISNLTATQAIAYVDVSRRRDNKKGGIYVDLTFTEMDRNDPTKILREEEVTTHGDETYFDASVVVLCDEFIKKGHKSLFLWKRIFGSSQSPEQGHPLTSPDDDPMDYESYKLISMACDVWIADWFSLTSNAERFWEEIWNAEGGIESGSIISARQGDAVHKRLEEGKRYKLTVKNTGQIIIKDEGASDRGKTMNENPIGEVIN